MDVQRSTSYSDHQWLQSPEYPPTQHSSFKPKSYFICTYVPKNLSHWFTKVHSSQLISQGTSALKGIFLNVQEHPGTWSSKASGTVFFVNYGNKTLLVFWGKPSHKQDAYSLRRASFRLKASLSASHTQWEHSNMESECLLALSKTVKLCLPSVVKICLTARQTLVPLIQHFLELSGSGEAS